MFMSQIYMYHTNICLHEQTSIIPKCVIGYKTSSKRISFSKANKTMSISSLYLRYRYRFRYDKGK